jgi:hypothetical protein
MGIGLVVLEGLIHLGVEDMEGSVVRGRIVVKLIDCASLLSDYRLRHTFLGSFCIFPDLDPPFCVKM